MEINFDKDEIIDSIKDLFTGDKKYAVWALSGVLFLTLVSLIVVSCPKRDKVPKNPEGTLAADEDLLVPDGPQSQVINVTSRNKDSAWGEDEEKRFLTVPSTAELDDLSRANDFMIKDIMGAAP